MLAQPSITLPPDFVPVFRSQRRSHVPISSFPRLVIRLLKEVVVCTRRIRHPPRHYQVTLLRPSTTRALELRTRWTVERQGKHILRFSKVRHEARAHDEVRQAEEVDRKDEDEDEVKDALPAACVTAGVHLRNERGVEMFQRPWIPENVARLLVSPEVNKWCADGAVDQR